MFLFTHLHWFLIARKKKEKRNRRQTPPENNFYFFLLHLRACVYDFITANVK